jgi:hypothetical protein
MPFSEPVPQPSYATPSPEAAGGSVGASDMGYSMGGHAHPRLTSATSSATNPAIANGVATVTFTRTFDVEPAVVVLPVGATTDPVIFNVESFVKDAGNKFAGCVVRAFRIVAQSLASVNVVGINVTVGGQTINVTGGNTTGQRYSVIALQAS